MSLSTQTLVPVAALLLALLVASVLLRRLGARTRRAEADSARLFEISPDPICTADMDGNLIATNPALLAILGYEEDELVGRPVSDLVHPADRSVAAATSRTPGGDGVTRFRNRWFDKQGCIHWMEWATSVLSDGSTIFAVGRDVSDRRGLKSEIERLSQRDPLTGVFNRNRFDQALDATLVDARRYKRGGALLLIDLDRFEHLNRDLGEETGNRALCEVARVLGENTRGGDTVGRAADGLVARLSGDEFAVLLAETGPVEAAAVGERLIAALEAIDMEVEGNHVDLEISVGVAPFEGGTAVNPDELLALADQAMYVVKAGAGSGADEASPAAGRFDAEPA